ncbi:protein RGF1 INDUCIBLE TRANSCRIPTION FACTOR 1-like [Impatiens glandulifera]|uniref:protein RGF1 INDUCIBLE TRANSCRIPTION FACTOR 1-like n=1 Tax=Impatiens glandulifera TaxID=253017 RepID=UPI001FB0A4F7|nr:protein RGF1 INDUCIBLE TRANSCRIPTION FACTOR 1-like [Impatiens glandulifera]
MVNFDHDHHLPRWVQPLLTEKFFNACLIHDQSKKNEKNIFCFHCCQGICTHCSSLHPSHRLLQIRRYVYHDVIRLQDAQKLIDCTFLQAYTTNSLKVVFLNHRPQITRTFRISGGSSCLTCDRALQEPFLFCSISCKIHHMVMETTHESNFITLPELEPGFEDEQLTPDSVMETSSINSSSSSSGGGAAAAVEVVRKKRSSVPALRAAAAAAVIGKMNSSPAVASGMMNSRRKGMPKRSPFF